MCQQRQQAPSESPVQGEHTASRTQHESHGSREKSGPGLMYSRSRNPICMSSCARSLRR
jgi:hypothetical protein